MLKSGIELEIIGVGTKAIYDYNFCKKESQVPKVLERKLIQYLGGIFND